MKTSDIVIKGGAYGLSPASVERIRLEQAEISFKAGIKEVVEWINEYIYISTRAPNGTYQTLFDEEMWQSKLKEWGIDG